MRHAIKGADQEAELSADAEAVAGADLASVAGADLASNGRAIKGARSKRHN